MRYGTYFTSCLLKGLYHLSEVAGLQTSFYHIRTEDQVRGLIKH